MHETDICTHPSCWHPQLQRSKAPWRRCQTTSPRQCYARPQHDLLLLQETHVNTNSTEVLKGHTCVYSTSITDEQGKQAETNRTHEVNEGKGRGKGQAAPPQPAVDREYHGVSVVLNPLAKLYLLDFEQISSRLMSICLQTAGPPIHILNAYAPQSGVASHIKEAFLQPSGIMFHHIASRTAQIFVLVTLTHVFMPSWIMNTNALEGARGW